MKIEDLLGGAFCVAAEAAKRTMDDEGENECL